jgi:hypothetical protein
MQLSDRYKKLTKARNSTVNIQAQREVEIN